MQLRYRSRVKGYTLLELIVVIAMLSIIVGVIIALIDPVEQLNRGKDTAGIQQTKILSEAVDNYYSYHKAVPWKIQTIHCLRS
jgi:prepilin-type N-terminal cleavage/methylation domain-containing protein